MGSSQVESCAQFSPARRTRNGALCTDHYHVQVQGDEGGTGDLHHLREAEESPQRVPFKHRVSAGQRPVFVHGSVHETGRDAPRQGRRARSTETGRSPSTEVSATTEDEPRRRRRASYCS